MPHKSGGKELAYPMWLAGKRLSEIQEFVWAKTGDKPGSVRGWILHWERGKQQNWTPTIQS